MNIDARVLRDLKRLQRTEGKPLERLISELLAQALARRRAERAVASTRFQWTSRRMEARVDLGDKEAVLAALSGMRSVRG